MPFCDLTPATSQNQYLPLYSVELNLLQLFEHRFNFRANLLFAHQEWGAKVVNKSNNGQSTKTWSGMLGMVENGSATFALCAISQSFDRAQSFDFTEIVYFNEITFISPPPVEKGTGLSLILAPFPPLIWALIVLSILLIILLIVFTSQLSTLDLAIVFLRVTLKQSLTFKAKSQTGVCLLVGLWILSALILGTFYTSIHFSILTLPRTSKPIDSIEDLIEVANSDSHQIVLSKASLLRQLILSSNKKDRLFYSIKKHLNRTESKLKTISQNLDQFEKMAVFITKPLINPNFLKTKNVVLHIAQERISADYLSILLRKESPLKKWFDPV